MTIEDLKIIKELPLEKRIITVPYDIEEDGIKRAVPNDERVKKAIEYLQDTKNNFDFIRYVNSLDKSSYYNTCHLYSSEIIKSYENCDGMILYQTIDEYHVIPIWSFAYAKKFAEDLQKDNWQEKITLYPIIKFILENFNYNVFIPIKDFKFYLETHNNSMTLASYHYVSDEKFLKDKLKDVQCWIDNKGKTYDDYHKLFEPK